MPDLLEGVLGRADDAQAAEQQADDADRQRAGAAFQRVDVALQLIADDRELAERRVQDFGLVLRVAFEHEAEHGHEQQQQREQRGEAVVGDQRRELPGAVVAELLDHRRGKAQPRAALLDAVERLEAVGEAHRRNRWPGLAPLGRTLAPRGAGRIGRGVYARERSTWCVSTRCRRKCERGTLACPHDQVQEMALVAQARRAVLLRVHRHRLRKEDLEDCYSQATLELLAQARAGEAGSGGGGVAGRRG